MPLKKYAIFKITPTKVKVIPPRGMRLIDTSKMIPALIDKNLYDTEEEAVANIPTHKGVFMVQEVYVVNPKPNLN